MEPEKNTHTHTHHPWKTNPSELRNPWLALEVTPAIFALFRLAPPSIEGNPLSIVGNPQLFKRLLGSPNPWTTPFWTGKNSDCLQGTMDGSGFRNPLLSWNLLGVKPMVVLSPNGGVSLLCHPAKLWLPVVSLENHKQGCPQTKT